MNTQKLAVTLPLGEREKGPGPRRFAMLTAIGMLLCLILVKSVAAQGGEPPPPGQGYVVRGRMWHDQSRNGLQDGGEVGIKQVGVYLINVATNAVAGNTITDTNGFYMFTHVQAGTYMLRFDRPTADGGPTMWEFTVADVFNNSRDDLDSDVDAQGATGPFLVPAAASQANANGTDVVMDAGAFWLAGSGGSGPCLTSLGGTIWRDIDRNGHQGTTPRGINEPGIAGVEVHLWSHSIEDNGVTILHRTNTGRSTITDATGVYQFRCLPEGSYYVAIPSLNGFDPTVPFVQALNNVNNDQNFYDVRKTTSVHPGSERFLSMVIALTQGQPNPNWTLDGGFSCDTPDTEVDLMLVIDRSRSMQTISEGDEFDSSAAIDAARGAARKVVQAMSIPPQRVGLIQFNGQPTVLAPLAPDAQATIAMLDIEHFEQDWIWRAAGPTNITAALEAARGQLLSPGHEGARKVVFLWSDGEPSGVDNVAAVRAKAAALRSAGIEVFTFGVTSPDRSVNNDLLKEIASSDSYFYGDGPLDENAMAAYRRTSPWACPDPMSPGETPIVCDVGLRGLIDLGTGAGGNRQIQVPGEDPRWNLMPPAPSLSRRASIVANPPAAWSTLPASQWIGPDASGNGVDGTYDYFTRFDLPGFVNNIRLFINMLSDDQILSIKVNGQSVDSFAAGAGGSSGEPRTLTIDQSDKFNLGGQNELRITVRNFGGPTGFDANGALQYCSTAAGDSVVPSPLGDTPKIIDIRANGIGTQGGEPTTGFPVRLLADVYVPPNVRLTSCVYSGDGIQQGNLPGKIFGSGSGIREDCAASFDLMRGAGPHPLTYGQKATTLTIRYVNDTTGAVGEIQRSDSYKSFFEMKGHDLVGIDEPNWFRYWRDDGAVPDLKRSNVVFDSSGSATALMGFDDAADRILVFSGAADPFEVVEIPQSTHCPGDTIGPFGGLDAVAAGLAHELQHREFFFNWQDTSSWGGADPDTSVIPWRDTDDENHPIKGGGSQDWGDELPDVFEEDTLGTNPNDTDSCGMKWIFGDRLVPDGWRVLPNFSYWKKGDNEFAAMRAMHQRRGIPSRDWANPGSQTAAGDPPPVPPAPFMVLGGRGDTGAGWKPSSQCLIQPLACSANAMLGEESHGLANVQTMESEESGAGSLSGNFALQPIDIDNDGLYDRLDIEIGILSQGAPYDILARITAADGKVFSVDAVDKVLPVGEQTAVLSIDGHRLFRAGSDGPYTLDRVELSLRHPQAFLSDVLDVANNTAMSPILYATQFEPTDVQILGSYTDAGVDGNADGALEALKLGVSLKANAAGVYNVSGILDTGSDKVLATSTVTLTTGIHFVGLNFPAGGVFRTRDDGAYLLESVRVENAASETIDEQAPGYTTAAYDHRQFVHGAVDLEVSQATDVASKTNPDAEGNEFLYVTFSLNGLDQATGFHVEGNLRDDQYGLVARSGAYVDAAAVQSGTIRVTFAGSHIRRSGADGPFTVSLTLFDGQGNVVDALPVAHVTAPYQALDFVAPPFDILGIAGGHMVDADNDNLADSLMIATVVLPHVTGDLTLMAGLDDPSYRTVAIGSVVGAVTAGITTTLMLPFDGAQIARNATSGPLTMRGVSGWMVAQPGQTVRWDEPFVTAYDGSHFVSPSQVVGTPGANPAPPAVTPTVGAVYPTPTSIGPHVP